MRRARWLVPALLGIAVLLGGRAGWIHAKAMLAQVLLERAWAGSDHGRHLRRPWPWADMAPIARLRVPRLHRDLIVLDRDSGQALAFGPGWTPSSAAPGAPGLSVISAHRDTQFDFLGALRAGDGIVLDSAKGTTRYRVVRADVVDSRRTRLPAADSADGLLLVTCYPFDAVMAGGPLRYTVFAQRVASAQAGDHG
nr:class GN sortase [Oleiagrimonas soli]